MGFGTHPKVGVLRHQTRPRLHASKFDMDLEVGSRADDGDVFERATFALGCFWGPDARFGAIDGVIRTRVGYAGGKTSAPSYENLGDHMETVQVVFDPARVSYSELLAVFWDSHSPEYRAFRRQYASAIFFHTPEQESLAMESLARQQRARRWRLFARKLHTELIAYTALHQAEGYHQKYRLRQQRLLLREFEDAYSEQEFIDSAVATKLNAYVAGYAGALPQLADIGFSRAALSLLVRIKRGEV